MEVSYIRVSESHNSRAGAPANKRLHPKTQFAAASFLFGRALLLISECG